LGWTDLDARPEREVHAYAIVMSEIAEYRRASAELEAQRASRQTK
jgi:hypothetical protein